MVALDSLRVDYRDQTHLPHSRRASCKRIVDLLRCDVVTVVAIPARCLAQQEIDGLPGRCGLFSERFCQVVEFAIGCLERVAIRDPAVVNGRADKGEKDESAEHDDAKPQTLEPDVTGVK